MKNKNIAEILKNAPKGILLYSPVFGYVNLVGITDKVGARDKIIANIQFGKSGNVEFDSFGRYRVDGECMLFPSKFHKTWDDWQESLLSSGDFITNIDGYKETFVLYNVFGRDTCEAYDSNGSNTIISRIEYRWATNEEKNGFLAELDRNGLMWNQFTNKMENKPEPKPEPKPKFKPGDMVRIKERDHNEEEYYCHFLDEMTELSGGIFKVKKISKQGCLRSTKLLDDDGYFYELYGVKWSWASSMLEPVEKETKVNKTKMHYLKNGKDYICVEDFFVNEAYQDSLFQCGEICHSDEDNTVKNHNGCMFIDGHDGNAEVYFQEINISNKELTKVKQYAYERWNKLWKIIPDTDKPDMTREDLNNLGRFMEIEQLNDFLEKL